ncbi:MAG: hypothetical protein AAGG59_11145 [Bacteroidota bacterium]
MRKAIQSLMVAVVLLGSIGLAKGGDPFVKVAKKGSKEFFLFMDTVSINEEKSIISLKDLSGGVIYTEQIEGSKVLRKLFDVKALPSGEYFLEIEKEDGVKSWSLFVEEDELKIRQQNDLQYHNPTLIQSQDNKLMVSLLNSTEDGVIINIHHDNNNEVLFQDTLGNDFVIQQIYDLSKLKAGDYTITVQANNRSYTKKITI